jgi:hypothetical protein
LILRKNEGFSKKINPVFPKKNSKLYQRKQKMANITLNQPKTTETVEVFVAKIIQNSMLKEQFKTVTSPKEAANKVVEIAEEHGLFLTEVQVLEWFDREQIRVSNMTSELGENELEETAGRMVVACNTNTRCGMCSLEWWNEFATAQ